jgi:hypothetical protein
MRYEQLSSSEFNYGHRVTVANQAGDVSRFFRLYYKALSTNSPGRHINKGLILGDSGSETGERVIVNWQTAGDSGPQLSAIFDGLEPPLDTAEESSPYNNGEWIAVQIEVRWGPGTSYMRIWINNDTYAAPTLATANGLSFTNAQNGEISVGAYVNTALGGGESFGYEHAAFRVATTFDSNWYGWLVE